MSFALGVIADDFTGACDVAAGVHSLGFSVDIAVGVPAAIAPRAIDGFGSTDCVVVALKTRTAAPHEAVADSVAAAQALQRWGATRIYQKYCSTFDSTAEGNIGPVADALLDHIGPDAVSVGTPATPAVGRTVYRGHLFVDDSLLSQSSLAHHPLTPMTDSRIVRLLAPQTRHPVALISLETVREGAEAINASIRMLRTRGVRHILFDAIDDSDLRAVADAVAAEQNVLTAGAAGLAVALAGRREPDSSRPDHAPVAGPGLIVSGSGSQRTRAQVAHYRGPVIRLNAGSLMTHDREAVVADAMQQAAAAWSTGAVPLVSATADPEQVEQVQQRWGRAASAKAVEATLAHIAVSAVEQHGVRRILVAGGETSGAVTAALGITTLRVRTVLDAGLAWTTGTDTADRVLDLCLKSGNFGATDLFTSAWKEPL
ncbi:3-oxo-tetronate kinase [Microbacterium sp. YY-01]|uniref:3-oxo-tetronate kinase n=1 Tax=Microbacterium sp. YY-01 TaxID=3421634 RepID=UPI003D17739C